MVIGKLPGLIDIIGRRAGLQGSRARARLRIREQAPDNTVPNRNLSHPLQYLSSPPPPRTTPASWTGSSQALTMAPPPRISRKSSLTVPSRHLTSCQADPIC